MIIIIILNIFLCVPGLANFIFVILVVSNSLASLTSIQYTYGAGVQTFNLLIMSCLP